MLGGGGRQGAGVDVTRTRITSQGIRIGVGSAKLQPVGAFLPQCIRHGALGLMTGVRGEHRSVVLRRGHRRPDE